MLRMPHLIAGTALAAAVSVLPGIARADEPTRSGHDSYTVQAGDTLFGIAVDAAVPLDALLAANGMTVDSLIVPGQQLELPPAAPRPSGQTHTIVAGDTLGGIAASYGVRLGDLLALNGLRASSLILPGQQLELPYGAAAARPAASGPVAAVLDFALAQVGKPYVFFTKGPTAFDCSGLTLAAYARAGIDLVHHSATQALQGAEVDFWNGDIRAGDLVFLDTDWEGEIDHVGIALGATTWVHASESRGTVLVNELPPKSVIVAVRRLVPG